MYNMMVFQATSTFSIGEFLKATTETLANYGQILIALIGVAMVIISIFQIAKNLISHGKGQTNWVITIALLVIGGAFAVTGGWALIGNIATGARNTLSTLGHGSADGGSVAHPSIGWN